MKILIMTALIIGFCQQAYAEEPEQKTVWFPIVVKQATGDATDGLNEELLENMRQATRWLLNHAKATTAHPDDLPDIEYHLNQIALPTDCADGPCPTGD